MNHDRLIRHANRLDNECRTWTERELRSTYSSAHLTPMEDLTEPQIKMLKTIEKLGRVHGCFMNQNVLRALFRKGAVLIDRDGKVYLTSKGIEACKNS